MAVKFYSDNHITIYQGDCRNMSELPDESVQCVVTSPPYFGLRQYSGLPDLVWDDDKDCQHVWDRTIKRGRIGWEATPEGQKQYKSATSEDYQSQSSFCSLCNAWLGKLGHEPTVEFYLDHLADICKEIKRVLRNDGTFFLNIGDTYWGSGGSVGHTPETKNLGRATFEYGAYTTAALAQKSHRVLKPKDLCLIPSRLAIRLQEDGWYVRSVIIWHKPSAMPESVAGWRWEKHRVKVESKKPPVTIGGVTHWNQGGQNLRETEYEDCPGCAKCLPNDGLVLRKGSWRPTTAHEYILMLTKSDEYYADEESVRVPNLPSSEERVRYAPPKGKADAILQDPEWWQTGINTWRLREIKLNPYGRNLRSVWSFPTAQYPDAHFAVYPERLVSTCIKAATSEVGCCTKCGKSWVRVLDKEPSKFNVRVRDAMKNKASPEEGYKATEEEIEQYRPYGNHPPQGYVKTVGWRPQCNCNAPRQPSLVLDPFLGSGTTALVAKKLGRRCSGYELSRTYCQLAVDRCSQQAFDFISEVK